MGSETAVVTLQKCVCRRHNLTTTCMLSTCFVLACLALTCSMANNRTISRTNEINFDPLHAKSYEQQPSALAFKLTAMKKVSLEKKLGCARPISPFSTCINKDTVNSLTKLSTFSMRRPCDFSKEPFAIACLRILTRFLREVEKSMTTLACKCPWCAHKMKWIFYNRIYLCLSQHVLARFEKKTILNVVCSKMVSQVVINHVIRRLYTTYGRDYWLTYSKCFTIVPIYFNVTSMILAIHRIA